MQILKKLSICGVLAVTWLFCLPTLGATVYIPGAGQLSQQDLNASDNNYSDEIVYHHGDANQNVIQPKIAQPQLAGITNDQKTDVQPDSNIVYVLKKKAANMFGGTARQANILRQYLGVGY